MRFLVITLLVGLSVAPCVVAQDEPVEAPTAGATAADPASGAETDSDARADSQADSAGPATKALMPVPELGPAVVPPAESVPPPRMQLPTARDPNELTPAESMAWRDLREVVLRERAIWDRLRAHPDDDLEQQRANAEFRHVMTAYENVIRASPKFSEAYAAYGLLLSRTGNREEAVRVFLKANQLNPNMPMVKNQIGNYLFEDGRYKEALGYYLAAIQLKGDEPLYHYQLGTLLREYRKFFIQDGLYTARTIDKLMQDAFREAARLAPENWPFIYRYAESFYDLENPNWPAALEEWTRLEARAKPGVEKQTIHLHQANVLARMGRREEARAIVDTIVEPTLLPAKDEVLDLIDPPAEPAPEAPSVDPAPAAGPDREPAPVTPSDVGDGGDGREPAPAPAEH